MDEELNNSLEHLFKEIGLIDGEFIHFPSSLDDLLASLKSFSNEEFIEDLFQDGECFDRIEYVILLREELSPHN